ncbi:MAG: AAA family ATPase [Thermoplasmata archaeon]|jgi:tetratricopeptide (TPR) repeat protein|nr:AAA family ATPase [Thermoplasmata archaeon]
MMATRGSRFTSRPPIFGREEIREEAERLLTRTLGGAGGGLLLTGPGGVGKTQILNGLIELATKKGCTVLSGRALPEELPPAFSLLRALLASERMPGAPTSPPAWALARAALSFAPAVSPPEVPETVRLSDDLEETLAPTGVTQPEGLGTSREELFARLERHLLERAQKCPLLIAIDDLHFADSSTLEFLSQFVSQLSTTRIAFAATHAESTEIPERTREAIETLSGVPGILTIPVRGLNIAEMEEFVRWIHGGRAPNQDDVRRWLAQTDGNPLFVEQLVRVATGYFTPTNDRDCAVHGVTEMLLDRVKTLGDRERRVLTYAVVLGKEFQFTNLSAVAGSGEEGVTESLDHLVHDGLVREKGGEVYEFVSEAVRRDMYASLTETRRRILHARVGRALEGKAGTSDSELARHFYLGREDAKAVEYNMKAARAEARDFAFQTAVQHVARALEAERRRPDRDPRVEVRLLTEIGRLLEEIGVLPRSEQFLTEAVTLARSVGGADLELGRALLGLAQTRATRNEFESAEALATEALERLEKVGTPRDLLAGHRVLGIVGWRRGEFDRAVFHQRAAVEIAEREGTPLELGHSLVDLANTLYPVGTTQIDPALELYGRAAALFETAGEFGARARVLMNQAVMEYHTGRPEDAIRDLTKAIEAADRSRSPIWIGYCNLNLSQWQAERHHPELARAPLARAHQVLGPIGDLLGDQQLVMSEGMIAEAERDYPTAEGHYQVALAKARELQMPAEVAEMLFRLAHLAAEKGERAEARRWLTEARASGVANFRPDFAERLEQLEKSIGTDG